MRRIMEDHFSDEVFPDENTLKMLPANLMYLHVDIIALVGEKSSTLGVHPRVIRWLSSLDTHVPLTTLELKLFTNDIRTVLYWFVISGIDTFVGSAFVDLSKMPHLKHFHIMTSELHLHELLNVVRMIHSRDFEDVNICVALTSFEHTFTGLKSWDAAYVAEELQAITVINLSILVKELQPRAAVHNFYNGLVTAQASNMQNDGFMHVFWFKDGGFLARAGIIDFIATVTRWMNIDLKSSLHGPCHQQTKLILFHIYHPTFCCLLHDENISLELNTFICTPTDIAVTRSPFLFNVVGYMVKKVGEYTLVAQIPSAQLGIVWTGADPLLNIRGTRAIIGFIQWVPSRHPAQRSDASCRNCTQCISFIRVSIPLDYVLSEFKQPFIPDCLHQNIGTMSIFSSHSFIIIMSNGRFPLELIQHIVRDAAQNAKTLCMLHTTWVPLIRPLIFDILVTDSQCDILTWQDLFTSAPNIPDHVRHIMLAPERMTPGDPVVVEDFLHCFPQVWSLALLSFELDYSVLIPSPLSTICSLILYNCLLDNILPDLKYAFPHLTVLHIIDFVAGNLHSHIAAEQADKFMPNAMAFLFVETHSTETIDMCIEAMAADPWFQGVHDIEIQGSNMVLEHFCS
ncbi:hypothetical protein ARMGADRAFT_1037791 [Armillaria gallica]|uniref:Uncharacterized protein n=1 Tax=Armillaria gallica TaxID=47427 RepID=A0A2H3CKR6_ARMGA|nr:hypothetical protein ARMGADRAFT_1037791 [Armillaria gallica]